MRVAKPTARLHLPIPVAAWWFSNGGAGAGGGDDPGAPRRAPAPRAPVGKPAAKSATGFDDMDDDIPF